MRSKEIHHSSGPTVPCCDLCDPTLLDLVRPGSPDLSRRSQNLKTGIVNKNVVGEIRAWRSRIWKRDYGESLFGPEAILSDDVVKNLASVGPILRLAELERIVGSQWAWFGEYGDDLLAVLLAMSIPPMTPKAPEARGTKRPAAKEKETTGQSGDGGRNERIAKRIRFEGQEASSGPVNVTPTFTAPAHFQPSPNSYPVSALYLTTFSASPNTVPTVTPTRMTHHAATPLTMNPYSRLMLPFPSNYYSPFPYQATFHYPNTPPTQWRTPSQIPNVSSSTQKLDSNLPPKDSIQP